MGIKTPHEVSFPVTYDPAECVSLLETLMAKPVPQEVLFNGRKVGIINHITFSPDKQRADIEILITDEEMLKKLSHDTTPTISCSVHSES